MNKKQNYIPIKTALMSVLVKDKLEKLGKAVADNKGTILSTGGTAKYLRKHKIKITDVSRYTGAKEILDGRVKTIHPKIAAGLLADRSKPKHMQMLKREKIKPIDMVVVNLYAFEDAVKRNADMATVIENIDIGGVNLIREAFKSFESVLVVVDPKDYEIVAKEIDENNGAVSYQTRHRMAQKAAAYIAQYDMAISNWFGGAELRYGENPHQKAHVIATGKHGFGNVIQHGGKEMSYNNYVDADATRALVNEFKDPTIVIVKHTNPCGVASDKKLVEAFHKARETDPVSAFGGIIASNKEIDVATAKAIAAKGLFFEIVIAPKYNKEALKILQKKPMLRILQIPLSKPKGKTIKPIDGALLVQDHDTKGAVTKSVVVSKRKPNAKELKAMQFAWIVAKHVKSNAIVFAGENRTLGIGAGQMNRRNSARIAGEAMREYLPKYKGTVVAASDAFFPFRDGPDFIAQYGATAIIQPGGSKRDDEVIKAADEHKMAMLLTGIRHFRH